MRQAVEPVGWFGRVVLMVAAVGAVVLGVVFSVVVMAGVTLVGIGVCVVVK